MRTNGQIYTVHSDYLGTPRLIADSSNNTVWKWDNGDVFGNNLASGNINFNLRFAGQYFDFESNFHYNISRTYNPATGRYMQSDPLGLLAGTNTYNYVGRNPMNGVDPLGLSQSDVQNIEKTFSSTVNQMTDNGLRLTNGYKNNMFRYLDILNPFSKKRENKLMDCGEQTEYMNKKLIKQAIKFDDNWNFLEVSGFSHAWVIAVSSNPNDPVIYYDTRANNLSFGSPCNDCHGLFYGVLDSWVNTNGFFNNNPINNPNHILKSYIPEYKF